jgi:hypothetical protein
VLVRITSCRVKREGEEQSENTAEASFNFELHSALLARSWFTVLM